MFIQEHVTRRQRPPTYEEISEHFGWSSTNAAAGHVKALTKKGYLAHGEDGQRTYGPVARFAVMPVMEARDGKIVRTNERLLVRMAS